MSRILCINDNEHHLALFADMLKRRDHLEVTTLIAPVDWGGVGACRPDLILVGLVRKVGSLRSPIANIYAEVEGASTLRTLLADLPQPGPMVVVTGIGVEARELPSELAGPPFVELPLGLDKLMAVIDELDHRPAPLKQNLGLS
ncbi:MAG: hypothetical protein ACK46X_13095 [Candidatus Sericytochromatia bacterium]